MCPLFRTSRTECTKPRVHIQPITCHATPQKDIPIPYMAQARHPLNIRALAIFFPFATIPAALHYFNIHTDYFLHNMVCHLSHCILLTPSHASLSSLSTLLSPLPAIHSASLPCTFYQQQNTIL